MTDCPLDIDGVQILCKKFKNIFNNMYPSWLFFVASERYEYKDLRMKALLNMLVNALRTSFNGWTRPNMVSAILAIPKFSLTWNWIKLSSG